MAKTYREVMLMKLMMGNKAVAKEAPRGLSFEVSLGTDIISVPVAMWGSKPRVSHMLAKYVGCDQKCSKD